MFQSTLPRRERQKQSTAGSRKRSFNPRSHAGSDKGRSRGSHSKRVSIHAPTQGATKYQVQVWDRCQVSIHAPTQGATLFWAKYGNIILFQSTLPRRERRDLQPWILQIRCFNPRSHAGSDWLHLLMLHHPRSFNPRSHAGSDHAVLYSLNNIFEFQSTLPRRERLRYTNILNAIIMFQSTLPRRERLIDNIKLKLDDGFNPRSHAGSDFFSIGRKVSLSRFNPRSHAGSDTVFERTRIYPDVSIHAPTQGATSRRSSTAGRSEVSIHAPTQGATALAFASACRAAVSIHAPTQGATHGRSP